MGQGIVEKIAKVKNLEANYKIAGEGKPLLVLHGWGGGSDSWVQVQQLLAQQGYQVVVPDLPGFGKTPPPQEVWGPKEYVDFVVSFMKALGIQRFFLVGHSNGGRISLILAATYPEKVENLVLCAPSGILHNQTKNTLILIMAKAANVIFSLPLLSNFKGKARVMGYRIIRRRDYLQASGIMKDIFRKISHEEVLPFLGHVKAKTLFIWGQRDTMVPREDGSLMARHINNAALEVLPGVGHNPHREIPERLAERISAFFSS